MGGFLVQPEAKYWFCIPFYKHFMGLHAHYGQYNGGFSKYRYQGRLVRYRFILWLPMDMEKTMEH